MGWAQDELLDGLYVLTVDTINPWIDGAWRKAGADGLEIKKMGCCLNAAHVTSAVAWTHISFMSYVEWKSCTLCWKATWALVLVCISAGNQRYHLTVTGRRVCPGWHVGTRNMFASVPLSGRGFLLDRTRLIETHKLHSHDYFTASISVRYLAIRSTSTRLIRWLTIMLHLRSKSFPRARSISSGTGEDLGQMWFVQKRELARDWNDENLSQKLRMVP
jgi:hypothetical protein